MKTHESESAGFLVWALPEVKNCLQKLFLHIVLYNYYSKKNVERFVTKNDAFKKLITHCIFEMCFDRGKVTFLAIKILKKPNPKNYAEVLVVACQ